MTPSCGTCSPPPDGSAGRLPPVVGSCCWPRPASGPTASTRAEHPARRLRHPGVAGHGHPDRPGPRATRPAPRLGAGLGRPRPGHLRRLAPATPPARSRPGGRASSCPQKGLRTTRSSTPALRGLSSRQPGKPSRWCTPWPRTSPPRSRPCASRRSARRSGQTSLTTWCPASMRPGRRSKGGPRPWPTQAVPARGALSTRPARPTLGGDRLRGAAGHQHLRTPRQCGPRCSSRRAEHVARRHRRLRPPRPSLLGDPLSSGGAGLTRSGAPAETRWGPLPGRSFMSGPSRRHRPASAVPVRFADIAGAHIAR